MKIIITNHESGIAGHDVILDFHDEHIDIDQYVAYFYHDHEYREMQAYLFKMLPMIEKTDPKQWKKDVFGKHAYTEIDADDLCHYARVHAGDAA
jgi:hypothetical protein